MFRNDEWFFLLTNYGFGIFKMLINENRYPLRNFN